jgi:hypothetical protein
VNGLAFASSLITSALWPIVVVVVIVVLRKPLGELIGRTRRYEGLGQKVEFGPGMAEAEDSVGKAMQNAPMAEKAGEVLPNPLVRQAEDNPSYVVLQAWDQLSLTIADLVGVVLPGKRTGSWSPLESLPALKKSKLVANDFVKAVAELGGLRNQVAHGRSEPTPGEAVAYAEAAQALAITAVRTMEDIIAQRPTNVNRTHPPAVSSTG